jgi:hypothetical protein
MNFGCGFRTVARVALRRHRKKLAPKKKDSKFSFSIILLIFVAHASNKNSKPETGSIINKLLAGRRVI